MDCDCGDCACVNTPCPEDNPDCEQEPCECDDDCECDDGEFICLPLGWEEVIEEYEGEGGSAVTTDDDQDLTENEAPKVGEPDPTNEEEGGDVVTTADTTEGEENQDDTADDSSSGCSQGPIGAPSAAGLLLLLLAGLAVIRRKSIA
jgi:MYXO-CTERM domain-containing protein